MAVEVQFVLFICHRKGIEINFISLPAFMSKMFIGHYGPGVHFKFAIAFALKRTFWHLEALPIQVQGLKCQVLRPTLQFEKTSWYKPHLKCSGAHFSLSIQICRMSSIPQSTYSTLRWKMFYEYCFLYVQYICNFLDN